MNFLVELLPSSYIWISFILYVSLLFFALWQAPWFHLKNTTDTHVFFASCLILWLMWRNSVGITPGMEFHLLLASTMTLMFGWPFAILGVSFAQLALTIEGEAQWASFFINTLCNGIIPIFVTYAVYWLVYIALPRHFFIYIFLTAFIGSALAMLISRLVGLVILLSGGHYALADLGEEPWFIVVMLFPEAFMNGLIMTILVVYRPQWVSSFSDKDYLHGK
jgi:uncharacterized membrane protein